MRLRRRIAVTVDKHEISISSVAPGCEQVYCARCGREVQMLPAALAAGLAGVPERLVYQLVEAGMTHFVERPDGVVLICPESLGELNRTAYAGAGTADMVAENLDQRSEK